MATWAPLVLEYCWSQMAMPALGGGEEGVDGVGLIVVGDAVVTSPSVAVGQSKCVVGGRVVQPQGSLVLVWTA